MKNEEQKLIKPRNSALNICLVISRFLWGKKHEFNLENPIIDNIGITERHSLGERKVEKIFTLYGWKCNDCDKVLWLDKEQMLDLPKQMKYGCVGKNGL